MISKVYNEAVSASECEWLSLFSEFLWKKLHFQWYRACAATRPPSTAWKRSNVFVQCLPTKSFWQRLWFTLRLPLLGQMRKILWWDICEDTFCMTKDMSTWVMVPASSKSWISRWFRTLLASIIFWMRPHLDNFSLEPGGRLNKKDGLTRYGDSHVKDKTS